MFNTTMRCQMNQDVYNARESVRWNFSQCVCSPWILRNDTLWLSNVKPIHSAIFVNDKQVAEAVTEFWRWVVQDASHRNQLLQIDEVTPIRNSQQVVDDAGKSALEKLLVITDLTSTQSMNRRLKSRSDACQKEPQSTKGNRQYSQWRH